MAQINKPTDYFNTKLYTGNFTNNHSITGVGFQPDLVWIKDRSTAEWHSLFDVIRGVGKRIYSNASNAEETASNSLISFDSDGFTLNADNNVNRSGDSFASWNWLGANTNASNTSGSITSTVSANTTSGFSIVSYAGNSSAGSTIGHSLGVAPKMIIVKDRDGADSWVVYHNSLPITEYIILNSTLAAQTDNEIIFYDTDPTSSVFTVGAHNTVNQSGHNYIAYCFAEKKGFSKFGSYTGNGSSNGTFIYTGFKPAMVITKSSSNSGASYNWQIWDNKRNTYNAVDTQLRPNTSESDNTDISYSMDFVSNGFKMRGTNTNQNGSGSTYIYMAFAENPLVGTNNIPATAR